MSAGDRLRGHSRGEHDLAATRGPMGRDNLRYAALTSSSSGSFSVVKVDHGLIVPLRLLLPRPDLPVIPIITQPGRTFSPFNAREFGVAMRDAIENSGLKVAVLATGGLSHWLDPGHFGGVDVEFDTYLLKLLSTGRGLDMCSLEPYPLLAHGQYEIMNWMIMLGITGPGVFGDVYSYEPMEASGGGGTVVNMDLDAAAQQAAAAERTAGVSS